MPAGKLMAQIRAKIELTCEFKGLRWPTSLDVSFDPQGFFGAVANHTAARGKLALGMRP
ncbi:MAG: hypothetical protein QOE78_132, partial [Alphaproteobacteria bacterium]|nr:hypothetical protein [Alphaproteobacteria bacterium]